MSINKYLFIDMEWNQKHGSGSVNYKEPVQIALIGTDDKFENIKLYSTTITNSNTSMQGNSLHATFNIINLSFPHYRYIVVWTMDTYDLYVHSMEKVGLNLPQHEVIVLQDVISTVAMAKGRVAGFKSALTLAGVTHETDKLHNSKYDVKYMFELYKKIYSQYQAMTNNESCIVNEKSKVIHTTDCRHARAITKNADIGKKALIFEGYAPCKCCESEMEWRRFQWEPVVRKNNNEKKSEHRRYPVTEKNIQRICNDYGIKCSFTDYIVFLTTKCGYWRIYMEGDKVEKVMHGNHQIRKSDSKKNKKFNEGFHQQKLRTNDFFDVLKYIYCHDRAMCVRMI